MAGPARWAAPFGQLSPFFVDAAGETPTVTRTDERVVGLGGG